MNSMHNKIAVFYPDTKISVWSLNKGLVTTLRRMGYEVLDAVVNPSAELESQDIILVSGPEYLWKQLRNRYTTWDSLKAKKYGWLHETVEREDYMRNPIAENGSLPVEELKRLTPNIFTPAAQDVKHGFTYAPFAVDTKVFTPASKNKNVLFVGSMYEKRRLFMDNNPKISVREYKERLLYKYDLNFEEYLSSTASAMAVLNLPTLSLLNSTRVYEAMACKALTITPIMGGHPDNYSMFKDRIHLLYYLESPVESIDTVVEVLYTGNGAWNYELTQEGQNIAEAGYQEVLKNHTLKQRLTTMLQ